MTADGMSSALHHATDEAALRNLNDTALMQTSSLSTATQRLDVLQT
jgi:hypothetical protein